MATKNSVPWHGFWVDAFKPGFKSAEECDLLIEQLLLSGAKAVFVQVRKRADAYFRKSLEPFTEDPAVPGNFDPLEYLLNQAHQSGIEVHAWLSVLPVWRAEDAPPKSDAHLFHLHGANQQNQETWLTSDEQGRVKFPSGYFLDPGHPEVQDYLARIVSDLIANYQVDGIHLDHIRYPPQNYRESDGYGVGYNPTSVRRFNDKFQLTGLPNRHDDCWKEWRREQVTSLVRRLRHVVKSFNPKICLSAALVAWGDGPADETEWQQSAAYNRVFQDWLCWIREELVDLPIPMNYDRDAVPQQRDYFSRWVAFEKQYCKSERLCFGLAAFVNDAPGIERQIRQVLASDAQGKQYGVVFFSYAEIQNGKASDRFSWSDLCEILSAVGGSKN